MSQYVPCYNHFSPSREGRDGTSHRQGYVDGSLIGEHCVERSLDVCTPSTHQPTITLPSIMFSVSNPTRRHSNDDAQ